MNELESFRNPPVVEALVDIRANLPETVDLGCLSGIQDSVRDRFPIREERTRSQVSIDVSDSGGLASGVTVQKQGYQYRSSDGSRIFQARMDGFTLNQLRPYSSWNALIAESRELWDIYRKVTKPLNVTRIAVRYINRIELPLPAADLKEYLRTVPEIAPDAPQGMSQFFMQIVLPDPITGCTAIVTETNGVPTPDLRTLAILLDIDVFLERPMDASSSEIWEQFRKLRDLRSQIFFGSITEKTMEMFR